MRLIPPVLTQTNLLGNPQDHQARYIEAAVQGVLITSIYLPNGNPQPGPKFDYKLAWFERLIVHARDLMASDAPVVLAGDYNVVPTPKDIYPTRSLDNNALIQPDSRQAFARLLGQGWTDGLRTLHPDGPLWTFWDYKYPARSDGIWSLVRFHELRPSPKPGRVGSCISLFEACSAFTHVTACMLAGSPMRPPTTKASAASLPPPPLRLLRVERTSSGAGLTPAVDHHLSRRTR